MTIGSKTFEQNFYYSTDWAIVNKFFVEWDSNGDKADDKQLLERRFTAKGIQEDVNRFGLFPLGVCRRTPEMLFEEGNFLSENSQGIRRIHDGAGTITSLMHQWLANWPCNSQSNSPFDNDSLDNPIKKHKSYERAHSVVVYVIE